MSIRSLELENVGPFRFHAAAIPATTDFKVCVDFDQDINLFIGPNNVGKSTILQAIDLLTEPWTEDFSERYLKSIGFPREPNFATVAMEWHNGQGQRLRFESNYGVLSEVMRKIADKVDQDRRGDAHRREMLMRPVARLTVDEAMAGETVGHMQCLDPATPLSDCNYAEWQNHKRNDFGYIGYATHTSYSLENPGSLADYSRGSNAFERDVYMTISRVVAQIMYGFPIQISVNKGGGEKVSSTLAILTTDGQVPFSDLSLGTRYALSWVIQFIDSFARRYRGDDSWRERTGILIIDEVDAHLHPSWQRRIIPTLKEYFPNVQIFASTHSPMMVAGLKKGQVHLLKREETGQVVWSRNERDIIGWTADEIYRTFMGIDDPTDERTARHAEELRNLRNKDALTPEDEARMQELRRLVNEDLLAGGWLKAQDERFDEMMRRFMANRMSDLSQDGA